MLKSVAAAAAAIATAPGGQLVERASGIIVPVALEREPEAKHADQGATAYDLDGRRRLVLMESERRLINRVLLLGFKHGIGFVVGCKSRRDGKEACGQPMLNEGRGTQDDGYGCKCTRIHFLAD